MSKRIPSLDGIRAVALAMVIVLHYTERYLWPAPGTLAHKLLGGMEVMWTGDPLAIFFILSGYLITSLLLKEFNKTNTISLTQFFERRAFRILPALFFYLGVAYVFCLVEKIPHNTQNFTSAIFFYRDYYFGPDLWITQHTWSLSVEEQFYLLWPFLLLWLLRRKGGRSTAARWAFALVLVTPLLRVGGKSLHIAAFNHHEMQMFHCRIDALMSGCLVALLVGTVRFERFYKKYERFWWLLAVEYWIVSLALGNFLGGYYSKSIGATIDSICMALLILWCTRNEMHAVGRVLNNKVLAQIGVASYSAYLYQTFFTHRENPTIWNNPWPGLLGLAVVTWISYNFVEQPFLKLRDLRNRKKPAPALRAGTKPDQEEPQPASLTGLSA